MNQILTKENDLLVSALSSLRQSSAKMDEIVSKYRPPLNGERYFCDKEVSERLKLSRRTLQEYRSTGIISYILLNGKVLYRESDINKLLNSNYYKAYK